MVWGCISAYGVGKLEFINGTLNSGGYINVLANNLLQSIDKLCMEKFIFQQDGAPCHKSKLISEWLMKKNIKTLNWAAQSPDLNPIENIWAYLKKKCKIRNLIRLKS